MQNNNSALAIAQDFELDAVSTGTLANLPEELRDETLRWNGAFLTIVADNRKPQLHPQPLANRFGVSLKTAQKKFYRFRKHGMAGLVDRRAAGPLFWEVDKPIGLSHQDRELLKTYCEKFQRNNEAAIRQLREHWKIGLVSTDTELKTETGYPLGWSERNLARFAPSETELTAARQGRSAAAAHRPLVYTTRRNLYVGQFFLFDDIWHDHFVNLLDTRQTGRPLEFHALDLASAYKISWGMRVR